jgi:hypothetical protein
MTRKMTRGEHRRIKYERAVRMREWLVTSRERMVERNRLDAKQRALLGDDGGGNGVTVDMREISGQARARDLARPDRWVFRHTKASPNREARRHDPRYGRTRHTRAWVAGLTPDDPGRYVWPTPPSRNGAYVAPRDTGMGDRA